MVRFLDQRSGPLRLNSLFSFFFLFVFELIVFKRVAKSRLQSCSPLLTVLLDLPSRFTALRSYLLFLTTNCTSWSYAHIRDAAFALLSLVIASVASKIVFVEMFLRVLTLQKFLSTTVSVFWPKNTLLRIPSAIQLSGK